MNNNPLERRWQEARWRGKPTPAEDAELRGWLAGHPEAQADWELETGLNEALDLLRVAPVASNFTAQVLNRIEGESREQVRRPSWWRGWEFWHWRWLPRTALIAVVGAAGLVTYHHLRDSQQENYEYARSVVAFSRVESLPAPAILENFDAIRALDQTPGPDEELLKLLK